MTISRLFRQACLKGFSQSLGRSGVPRASIFGKPSEHSHSKVRQFPSIAYTKIFFAFKAFNDLYKLSECVQTPNLENESLYICAAKDAKSGKKAILISNYSPARRNLKLDFSRNVESVFVIDYNYMFSEINTVLSGNKVLSMTPFSAYLIRIK